MKASRTLIALTVYLLMAVNCHAQWNWDPAVNTPVYIEPTSQFLPSVIPSDSGNVFVMWGGYDSTLAPYIPLWKMQRISSEGVRSFGDTGKIVTIGSMPESSVPEGTAWKDGGIVIAWSDYKLHTIWALDRYANTVWKLETYFGAYTEGYTPILVADGKNGFYVVPRTFSINWGQWGDTRVFHMDSTGTLDWAAGPVLVDRYGVLVAKGDGKGDVFIAHESPQLGLSLKKVDSSGQVHWGAPGENNLDVYFHDNTLQVVSDGMGGAFATWIKGNDSIPNAANSFVAHITSEGYWSTGPTGLDIGLGRPVSLQNRTSMLENGVGQVIVAWENYGDSIIIQCFDTTGTPLWNNGAPTFVDTALAVVALVRNTAQSIIVFYSKSNGSDQDIFAKMISTDGALLWNGNRKNISTATGDQWARSLNDIAVPHLEDGAFLAWLDRRTGWNDVYCTAIDGDGNNLPVELESFSAALIDDAVLLSWRTASETNNAGFRIQRSEDGIEWEEIGFVRGAGTAAIAHEYRYTDAIGDMIANSGLYYRLKQVDYDGSYDYSPVQYVALGAQASTVVLHNVYPNPASDQLQISFQLDSEYLVSVSVYSLLGEKVQEIGKGIYGSGEHNIQADIGNLPNGMYFIRMIAPEGIHSLPIKIER